MGEEKGFHLEDECERNEESGKSLLRYHNNDCHWQYPWLSAKISGKTLWRTRIFVDHKVSRPKYLLISTLVIVLWYSSFQEVELTPLP